MAVIEEELLGLAGGFERFFLCGGGGEVDDDLREFGDDAGEVGEGFVSFADDFGEHEAGQDAVASSLAWENDVARLLAAELDVLITHGGGNVGVADRGDFGGNISRFGPIEETLVGHDGDGDVSRWRKSARMARPTSPSMRLPAWSTQRQRSPSPS